MMGNDQSKDEKDPPPKPSPSSSNPNKGKPYTPSQRGLRSPRSGMDRLPPPLPVNPDPLPSRIDPAPLHVSSIRQVNLTQTGQITIINELVLYSEGGFESPAGKQLKQLAPAGQHRGTFSSDTTCTVMTGEKLIRMKITTTVKPNNSNAIDINENLFFGEKDDMSHTPIHFEKTLLSDGEGSNGTPTFDLSAILCVALKQRLVMKDDQYRMMEAIEFRAGGSTGPPTQELIPVSTNVTSQDNSNVAKEAVQFRERIFTGNNVVRINRDVVFPFLAGINLTQKKEYDAVHHPSADRRKSYEFSEYAREGSCSPQEKITRAPSPSSVYLDTKRDTSKDSVYCVTAVEHSTRTATSPYSLREESVKETTSNRLSRSRTVKMTANSVGISTKSSATPTKSVKSASTHTAKSPSRSPNRQMDNQNAMQNTNNPPSIRQGLLPQNVLESPDPSQIYGPHGETIPVQDRPPIVGCDSIAVAEMLAKQELDQMMNDTKTAISPQNGRTPPCSRSPSTTSGHTSSTCNDMRAHQTPPLSPPRNMFKSPIQISSPAKSPSTSWTPKNARDAWSNVQPGRQPIVAPVKGGKSRSEKEREEVVKAQKKGLEALENSNKASVLTKSRSIFGHGTRPLTVPQSNPSSRATSPGSKKSSRSKVFKAFSGIGKRLSSKEVKDHPKPVFHVPPVEPNERSAQPAVTTRSRSQSPMEGERSAKTAKSTSSSSVNTAVGKAEEPVEKRRPMEEYWKKLDRIREKKDEERRRVVRAAIPSPIMSRSPMEEERSTKTAKSRSSTSVKEHVVQRLKPGEAFDPLNPKSGRGLGRMEDARSQFHDDSFVNNAVEKREESVERPDTLEDFHKEFKLTPRKSVPNTPREESSVRTPQVYGTPDWKEVNHMQMDKVPPHGIPYEGPDRLLNAPRVTLPPSVYQTPEIDNYEPELALAVRRADLENQQYDHVRTPQPGYHDYIREEVPVMRHVYNPDAPENRHVPLLFLGQEGPPDPVPPPPQTCIQILHHKKAKESKNTLSKRSTRSVKKGFQKVVAKLSKSSKSSRSKSKSSKRAPEVQKAVAVCEVDLRENQEPPNPEPEADTRTARSKSRSSVNTAIEEIDSIRMENMENFHKQFETLPQRPYRESMRRHREGVLSRNREMLTTVPFPNLDDDDGPSSETNYVDNGNDRLAPDLVDQAATMSARDRLPYRATQRLMTMTTVTRIPTADESMIVEYVDPSVSPSGRPYRRNSGGSPGRTRSPDVRTGLEKSERDNNGPDRDDSPESRNSEDRESAGHDSPASPARSPAKKDAMVNPGLGTDPDAKKTSACSPVVKKDVPGQGPVSDEKEASSMVKNVTPGSKSKSPSQRAELAPGTPPPKTSGSRKHQRNALSMSLCDLLQTARDKSPFSRDQVQGFITNAYDKTVQTARGITAKACDEITALSNSRARTPSIQEDEQFEKVATDEDMDYKKVLVTKPPESETNARGGTPQVASAATAAHAASAASPVKQPSVYLQGKGEARGEIEAARINPQTDEGAVSPSNDRSAYMAVPEGETPSKRYSSTGKVARSPKVMGGKSSYMPAMPDGKGPNSKYAGAPGTESMRGQHRNMGKSSYCSVPESTKGTSIYSPSPYPLYTEPDPATRHASPAPMTGISMDAVSDARSRKSGVKTAQPNSQDSSADNSTRSDRSVKSESGVSTARSFLDWITGRTPTKKEPPRPTPRPRTTVPSSAKQVAKTGQSVTVHADHPDGKLKVEIRLSFRVNAPSGRARLTGEMESSLKPLHVRVNDQTIWNQESAEKPSDNTAENA